VHIRADPRSASEGKDQATEDLSTQVGIQGQELNDQQDATRQLRKGWHLHRGHGQQQRTPEQPDLAQIDRPPYIGLRRSL
jgi:hypothetical protein